MANASSNIHAQKIYGHGDVVIFGKTGETTNEFVSKLPKRDYFVKKDAALATNLKEGRPIFFRGNSQMDRHVKRPGQAFGLDYQMVQIGCLKDGTKAALLIDGMKPWFNVRVPSGQESCKYADDLAAIMRKDKACGKFQYDIVQHRPFMMYQENESDYVKFTCSTVHDRKKAIKYCRETLNLETANDDISCYYRIASRTWGIPLCDWIQVSNYVIGDDVDDPLFRNMCIGVVIRINYTDLKTCEALGLDFATNPAYRDYLEDRTLNMVWDLETHDFHDTGRAPDPKDVDHSTIFMGSYSFAWNNSAEAFLTINVTDMPQPPRADCLIIVVENQIPLINLMAIIMGRMAPDFVIAFNDGAYDWPFVIERAAKFGLDESMSKFISVINPNNENKRFMHRGRNEINVKIEATKSAAYVHYDATGYYCIDTKIIFQQLTPQCESSSLNYFLSENKLGSKVDMPVVTMFKVYRVMLALRQIYGTLDWAQIEERFSTDEQRFGSEYKLFEAAAEGRLAPHFLPKTGLKYTYSALRPVLAKKIGKLTIADIKELMNQATLVAHYCNVDAILCHKLLQVRNVLADRREKAILSWTGMAESLYRADGIRIRNLVMKLALQSEWNIACSNIGVGIKDGRKYPGAYVVAPKRGLYRDHASVKKMRRMSRDKSLISSRDVGDAAAIVDPCGFLPYEVDPVGSDTLAEIFDLSNEDESISAEDLANIDVNNSSGRPCFGVDANSLYPSEDMNYNFSPEKAISDPKYVETLRNTIDPATGVPYVFEYVEFPYGDEIVKGWFVQHDAQDKGMGIYPAILKMLFAMRKKVKGKMEHYAGPRQFLAQRKAAGETERDRIICVAKADLVKEKAALEAAPPTRKKYFGFRVAAAEHNYKFVADEWPKKTDSIVDEYIDFETFFADCNFWYIYYNGKQLTLKVFMNSFYGETGNVLSPFFIVLVAGGITTHGQMTIKSAKHFVEKVEKCPVLYGDTDSLYVTPPEHVFTEIDKMYMTGKITKLEFWTAMVEISMEYADMLVDRVNNHLYEITGMRYLRMAYEEVLWPYALLGRKKYIGVQHTGIANFSICMPGCNLKDFTTSKLLFIRGLEVKKRGSSELLKLTTYSVMKDAFSIDNVETIQQIIMRTLHETGVKKDLDNALFIKSGSYKLPKPGKPGNVTFNVFVDRMNDVVAKWPECGIEPPEMSERFKYVIVKRFPWIYDIRGRKYNIKVGDKIEYFTSLTNKDYIRHTTETRGEELVVDRDHYIRNEVIGQLARFLTYHPAYDIASKDEVDVKVVDISGRVTIKKFKRSELEEEAWRDERPERADMPYMDAERNANNYEVPTEDGDESANATEDDKAADKAAHAYAKKVLLGIFDANFASKYEDRGKLYKDKFKDVNKSAMNVLERRYGRKVKILDMVNTVAAKNAGADVDNVVELSSDRLRAQIRKRIEEASAARAKKIANSEAVNECRLSAFKLAEMFHKNRNGNHYAHQKKFIDSELVRIRAALDATMPAFETLCTAHVDVLRKFIDEPASLAAAERGMIIDKGTGFAIPVDQAGESADIDILNTDAIHIMDTVYDIYIELAAIMSMDIDLIYACKNIDFKKQKAVGANPKPASIRIKNVANDFETWYKNQ
jgi:DNA polymerase elongation subunit (family B)